MINGTVTDQTGAVVPNANVTVTDVAQGAMFKTVTDRDGVYTVPGLKPAVYNLDISATGYKQFESTGIVLRVAQRVKVDAVLTLGVQSSKVEVNGSSTGEVQTETAQVSTTITGTQTIQLVLNGRDFAQLVTLAPGVSNQTGQDEGTVGVIGSVAYSMNGGRTVYNNWEVDGANIMDNGSNGTLNVYPSIDAIAETQVLTSNYGAQYGRDSSGTIVAITKSGTEHLHGDAYEFLRNNAFNARNYFEQTVPEYKKHDFGFTVGGPVYIPKLYGTGKKRTFFFYSQEFRIEIVPGNIYNQLVPSTQERTGNFSDLCPAPGSTIDSKAFPDCPVNPATGVYFPGNKVPVRPNAAALLRILPVANFGSGATSTFLASPVLPTHYDEVLFRIDHHFNDNVHLFYRFIHDSWNTTTPGALWSAGSFPSINTKFDGPGVDMVTGLTTAFSPSLLNDFVASYTTDHIYLTGVPSNVPGIGSDNRDGFTGNGFFNNGYGGVLPTYNVYGNAAYGGGFTVGTGYFPWENANPTYSYSDELTKTFNTQTILAGVDFIAAQKNEFSTGNNQGTYTFSTSSAVTTGNAFADLLLGRVGQFSQTSAQPKYYNRWKVAEPYIQDDWRVTPRLTLNLGLRISLFGTYQDISNKSGNFEAGAWKPDSAPKIDVTGLVTGQPGALIPGSGNPFDGLVRCGKNGVSPGCMKGHLFNPAPRFGFAYDVFGNGKLAVRGGYGLYFEHTNGNEANSESLEGSAPVVQTPNKYNFIGYTHSGGAGLLFPLYVTSIPTHALWPYVQQYNLTIQGQLPGKAVLGVSYVGNIGRDLTLKREGNQLHPVPLSQDPYGPGQPISANDCSTGTVNGHPVSADILIHLNIACGNNPNPYRPFVGLANITREEFTAQSHYNSLQVALSRYFGKLNGSVAYTYSHSIDDASTGSGPSNIPNAYDIKASMASSAFDQRQMLQVGVVYDLPFFKMQHPGLVREFLGDWELSDITSSQTGTPFSINNIGPNSDNAGTGNSVSTYTSYPDIVGNIHGHVKIRHPAGILGPRVYNSDAFAAPRGLTYGDAGRNILTLPATTNFDLGLFKEFPIRNNAMHFEFRIEAFNAFNHTEWSGVNNQACYGAANCATSPFLTVTSAHNPRILQLAGKFFF
ncbi:MAG TPA: TonB-dependent receptor [Acidobacteriaceae bacterium]|nr:TonB-dependent receptor [Acidobacteriaceae bacterium]